MVETFSVPDWDKDPTVPIAPGGESWSEFVARASGAVRDVVRQHPGELVVAAVHAGVIEATMIAFLGVSPEVYRRGWVRIVPCLHDRMGVGSVGGPVRPVAFQRLVRGAPEGRGRVRQPPRWARARASGAQASQASSIASRRGFLVAARSCTRTAA